MNNPKLKIQNIVIEKSLSLINALKKMDAEHTKTLFIFDGERFLSILTIGDIQRSIINNVTLSNPVESIIESGKIYAHKDDSHNKIKSVMLQERAQYMPVLDDEGILVDVLLWDEIFNITQVQEREQIEFPVVIMAGGKGIRLKPLTNVIPKPLIPVGDKSILEEIMDQFEGIGCRQFYLSVNYKSDMIRFYLDQLVHKYNIELLEETKPLGTIGSVSLLKGKIETPFFVSNCDIVIDQDFRDVYAYHKSNNNDLTIITAVKSFNIPYGVIETGEDGLMIGLTEKPETIHMINTGVYILNPELIDEIPKGEFFHITHLMEQIKSKGGRVGCFPVSEHSWRDIGEWQVYLKMINVL